MLKKLVNKTKLISLFFIFLFIFTGGVFAESITSLNLTFSDGGNFLKGSQDTTWIEKGYTINNWVNSSLITENINSVFNLQNIESNNNVNLDDMFDFDYRDVNFLSVPWNMAYARINSEVGSVAARENIGKNIYFKPDGTKMYIVGEDSFTSGTCGYLTGGTSAESNYQMWATINDGSFRVIIDGISYNIIDINFSTVSSIDDVATIIEDSIQNMTGKLETCIWDTDHFVISSILGDSSSQASVLSTIIYGTIGTDISGSSFSDWMDSDNNGGITTSGTSTYGGDRLQEFTLSIPWDISTLRYNSYYDYSANEPFIDDCKGLIFSADGHRIYVANAWEGTTNPENYYSFTMSTAWDLSTISYDNKSYDFSEDGINAHGFQIKPDGTKLFVGDYGQNGDSTGLTHIIQYTFDIPYDISTLSKDEVELDTSNEIYRLNNFVISSDGTKIIAISKYVGVGATELFQYNLSSAFDLNTAIYSGISWDYDVNPNRVRQPIGNYITDDGNYLFILGLYSDYVYRLKLGNANTLDNVYYTNYISVSNQTNDPQGVCLSENGLKMYVHSYQGFIYQYSLSIPWDARSATYDDIYFDFSAIESNQRNISINNDGTKIYILGSATDKIYEIDLVIPYDLSSASYAEGDYLSVLIPVGNFPHSFCIGSSGTKMYIINNTGMVYQFTLDIAWDITSALYDSQLLNTSLYVGDRRGINISEDGNYLYISDTNNKKIYQYLLSTPFDITTGVYDTYFYTGGLYNIGPKGTFFKTNGKNMYISDSGYNAIFQAEVNLPQVYSPEILPCGDTYYNDFNIEIISETEGASIYYTIDGSDPNYNDSQYNGVILINGSLILKAIATKSVHINSDITSENYEMVVANLDSNVDTGEYISSFYVNLYTDTNDVNIYYTTDGTTPDNTKTLFECSILIDSNVTLKAIAIKEGYTDSFIFDRTYILEPDAPDLESPEISVLSGTYNNDFNIEITTETEGTTIYYTIDGSNPTLEDNIYDGSILISQSLTLRAIAFKEGYDNSNISSETYVLEVSAPDVNVSSGTYTREFFIEMKTETKGATIYYTPNSNIFSESYYYNLSVNVLLIDQSLTLKAMAFKDGYTESNITYAVYVLENVLSSTVSRTITKSSSKDT